jgi:hypothetical protein
MTKANRVLVSLFDEASSYCLSLNDRLTAPTEREFKETGQMIAPCTIARIGVMKYKAKDLGHLFDSFDPEQDINIGTRESDLFDSATLESARSAPITVGHPVDSKGNKIDVNVENAKTLMKGQLEGLPTRLGDSLAGVVVINDADAIAVVKKQADELSIGQRCELVLADEGDEINGEKVHAWKTNIRINHVAIVPKGRAVTARINDSDNDPLDVPTPTLEEVAKKHGVEPASLVDALAKGIEVELEHTTDRKVAEEIALDHLAEAPDYYAKLQDEQVSMFDQAHVDGLQASIDSLKEKVSKLQVQLSDTKAELENKPEVDTEMVQEVIKVLGQARLLDSAIEYTGQPTIELKRQSVVKSYTGKQDLSKKSDAYIEVLFDNMVDDIADDLSTSDVQEVLNSQLLSDEHKETVSESKAEQARKRMIARYEHRQEK